MASTRSAWLTAGVTAVLIAVCTPPGLGQIKTDSMVYLEPPLPTLPAAGGKLTDPVFRTRVMRLTDSADGTDCEVRYSYWPSFNLDNTYVQAECTTGGIARTKIWSFDPIAFSRGAGSFLGTPTASGWAISPTDVIWSGVDPHVIFGHPVNAQTINASNVANNTNVTLKDLTGELPSGATLQQMTKSIDDNVFAFNINTASGSPYGYIVWRRDTNSVVLKQADAKLDEVQVDKTGRYLTVVHTDGSNRIWDLSTGGVIDLGWNPLDQGVFHRDSGHGSVLTYYWNNGVAFRRLSSPRTVVRLLDFSSGGQDAHYSMLADNESWGTVSRYSRTGAPVSAPFDNEIFQVATDGSGRVRRLAHHRSVYNDYNDSPRANISRDGRYIAFTSNWGNANGRRDVFILQILPAP